MRLRTKHFWFSIWRHPLSPPHLWWRFQLRAGAVARDVAGDPPYRFTLAIEFQLIPNLLWYRHHLGFERGRRVFQDRIAGIYNWPFYFSANDWGKKHAVD